MNDLLMIMASGMIGLACGYIYLDYRLKEFKEDFDKKMNNLINVMSLWQKKDLPI